MKEYTLSQQYAIVGLDGLGSLHPSVAKNAVVHAIGAAKFLEDNLRDAVEMGAAEFKVKFENSLGELKKQNKKDRQRLEQEMAELLEADGVLEEAPDLLGCDMDYYTSGIDIKVYRSDSKVYDGIVERVRAEVLEEGPLTEEAVCLLWLFRESGCIHEIFSSQEQETVQNRMTGISVQNEIYGIIWHTEFHKFLESMSQHFLKAKKNLFKNPYLEGVNLMFPFLDRRQAIFVDFVILGTTVKSRRQAVVDFLSERGHYVEEVKNGEETLLKIDNAYYRIFPMTRCYKLPVQGAQLVPVYW